MNFCYPPRCGTVSNRSSDQLSRPTTASTRRRRRRQWSFMHRCCAAAGYAER